MTDQPNATTLPPLVVPEHVVPRVTAAYAVASRAVLLAHQQWTGAALADKAEVHALMARHWPAIGALAAALLGEVEADTAAVLERMRAPLGSQQ